MKYEITDYKSSSFLITRFNLPLYSVDKNNNPTYTEEWLEDRFKLFDAYCFPSIAEQSDSDFIWLCLFDENTPIRFVNRIKEYRLKMPHFIAVFMKEEEGKRYTCYVKQLIAKMKDGSRALITARVDNDDALHRDFIKTAKELLLNQVENNCIYSYVKGVQYIVYANFAGTLNYPLNHFPIMISKNFQHGETFSVIVDFNHSYLDKSGYPFRMLTDRMPMWVEVVHDHNVANRVRLQLPIMKTDYLRSEFGLDVELKAPHTALTFICMLPQFICIICHGIKRRLVAFLNLEYIKKKQ